MERPKADILYADESMCIVLCPYCHSKHKHGEIWGPNDARASHCAKGEYMLGDSIKDIELFNALKRRRYELQQKKAQYQKRKEQKPSKTS